jgi:hypothetical protein
MYIVSLFLTVCLPLVDRQSVLVSANLLLLSFALMVKGSNGWITKNIKHSGMVGLV